MIGVIYARYSSDNQREESIDGQLRECRAFAEKNDITLLEPYIDRALSAKTDPSELSKDDQGQRRRNGLLINGLEQKEIG